VEEGWINHKATYLIAEEYLKDFRKTDIDTLVLGCTHYPILLDIIQEVIGESVTLIDSGIASADLVRQEIERIGFATNSRSQGIIDVYVSDIPSKFVEVAQLFMGREIGKAHKVTDTEFAEFKI